MKKGYSLVGKTYGRLVVVSESERRIAPNGDRLRYWKCVCECGNIVEHGTANLVSNKAKSCGCYRREIGHVKTLKHGENRKGLTTKEYSTWARMKDRCLNANNPNFKYWGGRGIKVCDRWVNSFENFLADMGRRPSRGYSLDRINNNGNYEPGNCRWATHSQQVRNRRPNGTAK